MFTAHSRLRCALSASTALAIVPSGSVASARGWRPVRCWATPPAVSGPWPGPSWPSFRGITVVSGCVVAAVGLLPRWAVPVSWSVLFASVLLGPLFGPTLDAPQWAQNLSAFTHVAKAPATAITAAPLTALTAVSLLLVALGTVSFRHRNLALPA